MLSRLEADDNSTGGSQCEAAHNIYFLKVHKCGSTTVYNTLFRYGIRNKLTFMLFKHKWPYPEIDYTKSMLSDPVNYKHWNNTYNMFIDHSIYNETYLMKRMPHDVRRIAIIREPVSYLRSVFHFYNLFQRFNLEESDLSIGKYLENQYPSETCSNSESHCNGIWIYGYQ